MEYKVMFYICICCEISTSVSLINIAIILSIPNLLSFSYERTLNIFQCFFCIYWDEKQFTFNFDFIEKNLHFNCPHFMLLVP